MRPGAASTQVLRQLMCHAGLCRNSPSVLSLKPLAMVEHLRATVSENPRCMLDQIDCPVDSHFSHGQSSNTTSVKQWILVISGEYAEGIANVQKADVVSQFFRSLFVLVALDVPLQIDDLFQRYGTDEVEIACSISEQ